MFFQQVPVGTDDVFAYLIADPESGDAAVVDPAGDADLLIRLAAEQGTTIRTIVNTHGHVDHVMGNREMKAKTGAAIAIHEAEADYLEKIGDTWLRMFRAERSPPADLRLSHGDLVRVGRYAWRVLHTPGHSPGSICLYHEPTGRCLTGDTLFVSSVGRTDGPRSSGAELLASIEEQLLTLPDETVVFPGHDYGDRTCSTIGEERAGNPFLNGTFDLNEF